MKLKFPRIALVLFLCISLLLPPAPVGACGPFFPEVIFTYRTFPGLSLKRFDSGDLGILQPTFSPRYLFVAYRYLNASPLTTVEQNAAIPTCASRCDEGNKDTNVQTAIEKWQAARKQISSVPVPKFNGPDGRISRHLAGGYIWMEPYPNCLDPAFETASATLSQRVRQFGAESPAVRSWTAAQDAVFTNCNGSLGGVANYPDPPDSSLPEIIRADRSYQIAAAHFYAGDFDGAGKMFSEIARDPRSPWRAISALLVARSLIRKATLNSGEDRPDLALLKDAEKILETIIGDSSLSEIHPAAARLQGFVLFRVDPGNRLDSLAQRLTAQDDETLAQDLYDYEILLERGADAGTDTQVGKVAVTAKPSPPTISKKDSMTDWIETFRNQNLRPNDYSFSQWMKSGSLAWLLAALTNAKAGDAQTSELIAAARRVPPGSPGYVSVTFQRLRLEAMSGERESARTDLDAFLKAFRSRLAGSDLNMFVALRMSLAGNLDELLQFSARTPAITLPYGEDYEGPTPALDDQEERKLEKENAEPRFDLDGAWMLTRGLPTALLLQSVQSNVLSESLRQNVARATWVRAVMLDDQPTALKLAPIVGASKQTKSLIPSGNDSLCARTDAHGEIPDLATIMKEYQAAQIGGSRRFQGILTILRVPGLRPFVEVGPGRQSSIGSISSYRDNWWSGLEDRQSKDPFNRQYISAMNSPVGELDKPGILGAFYAGGYFSQPEFLTDDQRREAQLEWSRLSDTGVGSIWLARQVMAWAKSHPGDPRVPEALHLSVRALRYGYSGNGELSKEAFDILHHRYPNSEWTKKTPYWFN